MSLNIFKIAYRNMMRMRLLSFINLVGLTLAIAATLIIALYIEDELQFDQFWPAADKIYRVQTSYAIGDEIRLAATSPAPLAEKITANFAEDIEAITRLRWSNPTLKFDQHLFTDVIYQVDTNFSDIFALTVVAGDLNKTLQQKRSIAISQEFARQHLNFDENRTAVNTLIGEVIEITNNNITANFQVGAVYQDVKHHSILALPAIISLQTSLQNKDFFDDHSLTVYSYLKTKVDENIERGGSASVNRLKQNINAFYLQQQTQQSSALQINHFDLVPITSIHLFTDAEYEMKQTSSIEKIYLLCAVSLLILLAASINFMNVNLSKIQNSAKEVALRKMLGANKSSIYLLSLQHALLLTSLSCFLALVICEWILPLLNPLLNKALTIDYIDSYLTITLLFIITVTGLIAGLYPARLTIKQAMVNALQNPHRKTFSGISGLMRQLIAVQVIAASLLFFIALTIFMQLLYLDNQRFGFERDHMLVVNNIDHPNAIINNQKLLAAVVALPAVKQAAFSEQHPVSNMGEHAINVFEKNSTAQKKIHSLGTLAVGKHFFETYQVTFLAGSGFTQQANVPQMDNAAVTTTAVLTNSSIPSTTNDSENITEIEVVINKSVLALLGWPSAQAALNKQLISVDDFSKTPSRVYVIKGVIADIPYRTRKQLTKADLFINQGHMHALSVSFIGDSEKIEATLFTLWQNINPGIPFNTQLLGDEMAAQFIQERKLFNILAIFTLLTLAIASIGAFSLTILTIEKQRKNIAIHKVLGASNKKIIQLIQPDLKKNLLIYAALLLPIALYLTFAWLNHFPYRFSYWLLLPGYLFSVAAVYLFILKSINRKIYAVTEKYPAEMLRR
jgi:putative ABC transport system permease protein